MNHNDEGESHGCESSVKQKLKLPPPRPMAQSGIHVGFRIEPKPLRSRPSNFGEKKKFQARPSDGVDETPEGESKDGSETKPKDPGVVWKRRDNGISWQGYVILAVIIIALIGNIWRSISSIWGI